MHDFDIATQVQTVSDGIFRADLDAGWNVGPIPNGGYLLSVVTGAFAAQSQHPHPLSLTAQYLRPSSNGPATLTTEVVKRGRQVDFLTATLSQDGKERLRATGLFGNLERPGGAMTAASAPDLPPPDQCDQRPLNPKAPAIANRFEFALHPDDVGIFTGNPTGEARLRGWIRFADGRLPDLQALPTIADSFPPPIFQVHPTFDWVPTLELGIQWRRAPGTQWLACEFRSHFMAGGYLEEDGRLWDGDGQLVAISRQLAHIRVS